MENKETGLEKLSDTIETVITGIPVPVRKNFLKALAQLTTAAIDIPTAWLHGKSAEIKATFDARVEIIKKQGENYSSGVKVPDAYIDRASSKYAAKVIKEQLNLDEITMHAANELSGDTTQPQGAETKEISDDWLNEFENYARLKSSDDMKLIFGKILSGEIKRPGTFSIRTIRIISQLDNVAAELFQTACSLACSIHFQGRLVDSRVLSLGGSPGLNSLEKYGLSFSGLNILQEFGLVIPELNSAISYEACIPDENNMVNAYLTYGGKNCALFPIDSSKMVKTHRFQGIGLTEAGKELSRIIPLNTNDDYSSALHSYFKTLHFELKSAKIEFR